LHLALLPIERGAVDAQGDAEFVLPRQAQFHHLDSRHAAPHRIIGAMNEQRHARGEVRHVVLPLDHGDDAIDLPGSRGLDCQV
jgi:hypothetical protein